MGAAFAAGLERAYQSSQECRDGLCFIVEPNQLSRQSLQEQFPRWRIVESADSLPDKVQTVILAVKPLLVTEVLRGLAPRLKVGSLVLSCCAGVTLRTLADGCKGAALGSEPITYVRCMPNLGVKNGHGAIGYTIVVGTGDAGTNEQFIGNLFQQMGYACAVTEDKLDAVTALSGSGPGYFAYFVEHLERAGVELGLDGDVVRALLHHTLIGTGYLLEETGVSAERLRIQVTSPNGTTDAALTLMATHGVGDALQKAVHAAAKRSEELGRLLD